jgi:hypothetical protein
LICALNFKVVKGSDKPHILCYTLSAFAADTVEEVKPNACLAIACFWMMKGTTISYSIPEELKDYSYDHRKSLYWKAGMKINTWNCRLL